MQAIDHGERSIRRCAFNTEKSLDKARIAIVGLGLMGGSLAKACQQRRLAAQVVGIARRSETVRQAEANGIIDWGTTDLEAGVAEADIIVLSTPVRTILSQINDLCHLTLTPCLVLDMGSTKRDVVQAMQHLPAHVQAIGTHPMCGKETRGLEAADATLYEGATWILVPLERTTTASLDLARQLVAGVGARPLVLDAERHDRLVATTSHLPYALAVTLLLTAGQVSEEDALVWQLAASGFRDTSRVAGSDVTMMLDILLTNRDAVYTMLERASANLQQLIDQLANGDESALRALLAAAQALRLKGNN